MRRLHRVLLGLSLGILSNAGVTDAQMFTGPFTTAQSWWIGPGGTTGVLVDAGMDTIRVDTNGDGTISASDNWYPFPAELSGSQLRLAPSREYLYAFRSSQAGDPSCTPSPSMTVFFYEVPPAAGSTMTQLALECIPAGIAQIGFYDRPATSCLRLAYIVSGDTGTGQRIFWFDLANAVNDGGTQTYDPSVGFVQFAPSGNVAFVQHDLSGSGPSNYNMVDMCPGSVGQLLNVVPISLDNGPPSAEIVDRGGGDFAARIIHPDLGGGQHDVPQMGSLVDCTCAAPPGTGACCLPDGSCDDGLTAEECGNQGGTWAGANTVCDSVQCQVPRGACCFPSGSCLDDAPQSFCDAFNGTWYGPGSLCEDVDCPQPPSVEFFLSKSGPASVIEGQEITYIIDYGNNGDLDANDVVLEDVVASSANFEYASGNGTYESTTRTVTWAIGTLPSGTALQETLVVRAKCFVDSVHNTTYSISGTSASTVVGATVSTNVTPASSVPLVATVTSVPENSPLDTCELVTHTIELGNTIAELRPQVAFQVEAGIVSEVDSVLQDAGGTVTKIPSTNPTFLSWKGDIGPNDSVQVVFTTKLSECRSEHETFELLNRGFDIDVRNGCGATLNTLTPADTIPLVPFPVQSLLVASNHQAPEEITGGGIVLPPVILIRADSTVEMKATILNRGMSTQSSVFANIVIPANMTPAGDPPFIGTPPAGTTWNSGTQTIGWSGSIAALDTICIRYGVTPQSGECFADMNLTGGTGNCTNNVRANVRLLPVPQPPGAPHVLGLNAAQGVWILDPANLAGGVPWLLCMPGSEVLTGMTADTNGDIWVVGLPTFRFNPWTLAIEGFDGFFNALDQDMPQDVVIDPTDGSAIMLGSLNVPSSGPASLWRYHQNNGQVDVLLDGTAPTATAQHMVLDPDGMLAASGNTTDLYRIDPVNPGSYQTFTDASIAVHVTLALDTNGDYLATPRVFGTGNPRPLAKIERATGTYTTLIADLNSILPSANPYVGSLLGPNNELYLGPQTQPELHIIDMDLLTGQIVSVPYFGSTADLVWVGGVPTSVSGDLPVSTIPRRLALGPISPNPFNPSTRIAFSLPRAGDVSLVLYDVRGRIVRRLLQGKREAGRYSVIWNGRDTQGRAVASGVYMAYLRTASGTLSKKLVLAR